MIRVLVACFAALGVWMVLGALSTHFLQLNYTVFSLNTFQFTVRHVVPLLCGVVAFKMMK